jgi:hypothetical protein
VCGRDEEEEGRGQETDWTDAREMKMKKGGDKRRIGRTRETKTEEKMRDPSRLVRRRDKSTTRNTEKDKGFQKQKERN